LSERAIHASAIVVIAGDVLSSELGSEHVLLNLRDSTYYGLDEVGGAIWKLLQAPISVEAICCAIGEAYDVEPDRCRQDVMNLLGELVERRLVDIHGP